MYDNKAFEGSAGVPRGASLLNKIEDIGELRSKLSQLEEAILGLTDHRDRLAAKLQPVLQVQPQPTEKGIATCPSLTEIGNRIQSSIDRVYAVARSLDNIRQDAQI